MTTVRLVVAGVLGLLSFAVVVGNWELAFTGAFRGRRGSMVPLAGGVSGAIAIAVAPWRYPRRWAVLLLLDLGSATRVGGALVQLWRDARRPKR